ncbi:MAG: flagellar motor protein MotB, partial [Candidatus Marinimicrobia bacterium]|nr:flagellar motor protein MotB [Candidatus Neomarinimicrobiota bacterium]
MAETSNINPELYKRKRPKKIPPPDQTEQWLLTYGDMVTLMMTFFILLFSMSTIDPVKLRAFADAFSEGMGASPVQRDEIDLAAIMEKVTEIVIEQNMQENVTVSSSKRGVNISFKGDVAFKTGSAELSDLAKNLLDKLAPEINAALQAKIPFPIAIEGHTDNVPLRAGGLFPSNWELSTARASATVRYLINEGGVVAPEGQ